MFDTGEIAAVDSLLTHFGAQGMIRVGVVYLPVISIVPILGEATHKVAILEIAMR